MEHQYGIVVSNRFQIDLGEVEDPEDFITETKKEKVKSPKQKTQDSLPKKQESDTKSKKEDAKDSKSDSRRGGKGRGNNTDSRPPRRNREGGRRPEYTESVENQENQAPNELRNDRNERPPRSFGSRPPRDRDSDRPPRAFGERFGDRSREGDTGDRPPRGRGGRGRSSRGRGADRDFRGKREFDRRSGSDKSSSLKPQDKREGGGTHNWGSFKDDVKEADTTTNAVDTFTTEEWDAGESKDVKTTPDPKDVEETATKEGGEAEEEEVVEKEPEVVEMTLDEYKAQLAGNRRKQDFNVRKPGEGEDKGQWKKTYVLKKSALDDDDDKDEDHVNRDKPKNKDHVDINISFYDQPTRGGRGGRRGMSRGGRGRGRGGGGRGGGGRGGRSRGDDAQLSLADDAEFPSLG